MKVFVYVVAASKNPDAVECVVPYRVNDDMFFWGRLAGGYTLGLTPSRSGHCSLRSQRRISLRTLGDIIGVTPVTEKYLCVVVKVFIITAYFTDKIKRGEILWKRK